MRIIRHIALVALAVIDACSRSPDSSAGNVEVPTLVDAANEPADESTLTVPDPFKGYVIARTNGSSTCEVHRIAMGTQRVALDYGMKRDLWHRELQAASAESFPNAGEPYDTGYCLQPRERWAAIFVCPNCTTARTAWFALHPPRQ